jgi:hypothetical protein
MIPGQQSLLKANSQAINPTTIGWLLGSNPTMVDYQDLEKVLRVLWNVKGGFGLYYGQWQEMVKSMVLLHPPGQSILKLKKSPQIGLFLLQRKHMVADFLINLRTIHWVLV